MTPASSRMLSSPYADAALKNSKPGEEMLSTAPPHRWGLRSLGGTVVGLLLRAAVPGVGCALLAPVAAHAEDLTLVNGVRAEVKATGTEVRIELSQEGSSQYSIVKASNPDRLMIDLSGARLGSAAATSGGFVSRAEVSSFNDGTESVRVTLWLSEKVKHEVRNEGKDVVIALSSASTDSEPGIKLSGPQSADSLPALASLDFQQRSASSRVILGLRGVEPTVQAVGTRTVTVDLPGARMSESLNRDLDTTYFASAIDRVRAVSTKTGVRVTVTLRADVAYEVVRDGGLYILEFPTPANILAERERALQRAATAAPSTPTTSGEYSADNGNKEETIITAAGSSSANAALGGSGRNKGTFSFVDTGPITGQRTYTGERINIEFQEADIHTVFRFIADFAQINIITSDDVAGKVTVRLAGVPWDEALAAVLQSKGLGAQQIGNIVRVAPIEKIRSEQQTQLDVQKFEDQLEELPVLVAPLSYATAADVAEQIKGLLSERGSVQVDERGNQLIITDKEKNLVKIRELLKSLDLPNREVMIEARFVEAATNYERQLGIDWGGDLNLSAATGYPTGLFFPNSIGVGGGISSSGNGAGAFYSPGSDNLLVDLGQSSAGSLAFSLGSIPGVVNIDARLTALEREGWSKTVSSPRITVMDNETAKVEQGRRIPIETTSNAGTQVQLIQATLELSVTPHITADGTIFLDITLKNDRPDFGNVVQGRPTIEVKEVTTQVLVADGDTTVLGGVYQTQETWAQTRVPWLSKIPILGYFFKNSTKTKNQTEMLVFITPHIVDAHQD